MKAKFDELKRTKRSFSYRNFAKQSGLSIGLLTLTLNGQRNLSHDTILRFARGLKLNKEQTEFFENLVYFNQAKTQEEQTQYFEKLSKFQKYREIKLLEADQFEYFSKWYYAAVRELMVLPNSESNPQWISKQLIPKITVRQAEKAVELLLRLNLVERTGENKLISKDTNITSGQDVQSLALANFHRQMILLAHESIERIAGLDRDISSVTITIDKSKLADLKKEIQEFRKKLLRMSEEHIEKHDHVYQLNMQLFPLSKKGEPS